ncbi:MAG TPA: type II toxin-antitoxin system death-on-curing family toxin [Acidobacteriota bacterium]|nr:type II toxin-antitoxin system death-on-curing family toxin [Acidobacteriota bacterium]
MPRLVIEAVHLDQIREHGGLIGMRDESALDSALKRAPNRWAYDPDSDLPRLAAAYVFGMSSNHPFRDGNKRIAFLTGVIFLGLNGLAFDAPPKEVVTRMIALASGHLEEDALAEWIRSRTRPQ